MVTSNELSNEKANTTQRMLNELLLSVKKSRDSKKVLAETQKHLMEMYDLLYKALSLDCSHLTTKRNLTLKLREIKHEAAELDEQKLLCSANTSEKIECISPLKELLNRATKVFDNNKLLELKKLTTSMHVEDINYSDQCDTVKTILTKDADSIHKIIRIGQLMREHLQKANAKLDVLLEDTDAKHKDIEAGLELVGHLTGDSSAFDFFSE